MHERRGFPRQSLTVPILINGSTYFTEDVSAGGARASSLKPLPQFEEVRIELYLSTAQPPIQCGGVVTRVEVEGLGYKIGIQFTRLSRTDQQRLALFLAQKNSPSLKL